MSFEVFIALKQVFKKAFLRICKEIFFSINFSEMSIVTEGYVNKDSIESIS